MYIQINSKVIENMDAICSLYVDRDEKKLKIVTFNNTIEIESFESTDALDARIQEITSGNVITGASEAELMDLIDIASDIKGE